MKKKAAVPAQQTQHGGILVGASSTSIALAPFGTQNNYRTLEMIPIERSAIYRQLRRTVRFSFVITAAALIGVGTLLSQTVIAGAVITHGSLVVETGSKQVQHPDGGVVAKLLVKEDQAVKAGQPVVILDQTVDQAKVSAIARSLAQQNVRLVRLHAERDGLSTLVFPAYDPSMKLSEADYKDLVDSETRQFNLRRQDRDGQRSQISQRIVQAQEEINAQQSQLDAAVNESAIVSKQLDGLRALFAKQLIPHQQLSDAERDFAQLTGQIGALRSNIAEGKGKISELQYSSQQVDETLRSDLTDQIAQSQSTIADLSQQLVTASDLLSRTVITAPLDGVVHELQIHTVGGVIQPAETLMMIVPQNEKLIGEVKISPSDIDQLYPGQPVDIHFTAFDRNTTPTVQGSLVSISPDLTQDKNTGATYYVARIEATEAQLNKLGNLKLIAGMPLDAYVKTGDRTVLSYLTKPLTDQADRAFR